MSNPKHPFDKLQRAVISRRDVLKLSSTATAAALFSPILGLSTASAAEAPGAKNAALPRKAFVYTELQISVPFDQAPWRDVNRTLLQQPGLLNKTWLAGVGNHSLGGIYLFDNIENAQQFVTGYFPGEAKKFGAAQTTRIFDAAIVEEASRDMNSVHFGGKTERKPGAFVYTEVQVNVPFASAPWRQLNPTLKAQPGLLSKTWLSGLNTNTLGGIYAFDTLENATSFALGYFPGEAAGLNAAFYTRIFDAGVVEEACLQMQSPFFS